MIDCGEPCSRRKARSRTERVLSAGLGMCLRLARERTARAMWLSAPALGRRTSRPALLSSTSRDASSPVHLSTTTTIILSPTPSRRSTQILALPRYAGSPPGIPLSVATAAACCCFPRQELHYIVSISHQTTNSRRPASHLSPASPNSLLHDKLKLAAALVPSPLSCRCLCPPCRADRERCRC